MKYPYPLIFTKGWKETLNADKRINNNIWITNEALWYDNTRMERIYFEKIFKYMKIDNKPTNRIKKKGFENFNQCDETMSK